ncbi:cobalamin-independent methionine synthase [Gordonia araii NBRC 100433]|uniref:5-methyltetrahydropteroyltriglutamate--homocysteine S-methyltransferase n=1 Tax=Gordonia araii NBRC 100433 TaxID=1073574 RepID=G7H6Z7_9ACTN|nr:5-methyltetrahydropteroyltriglutamate--homocysteine S-methyltransferase [Gordonia araii]NNG97618.1 5-methyltetrahydropteroyltriglutamate--homocysteine S-methyltransferase [Gordonia araii NBRC 100433]GAB11622.1 cobalamin-independent methionine synthase [Gordonia araii NBRC 100433]
MTSPDGIEYGSSILGYPRIGARRELKFALEGYWRGSIGRDELLATGRELADSVWLELAATGLEQVPGNTFSFYDHVLDTAVLFGATPPRFADLADELEPIDYYFAMARGKPGHPPLELIKYFNTNYFYRQPEIDPATAFSLHAETLLDEHRRAKAEGIELRPVVVGPVSFLLLSKAAPGSPEGFAPIDRLDDLLPVYAELMEKLAKQGCKCIQFDEPCFTSDRTDADLAALRRAYTALSGVPTASRTRILVTGPYGDLGEALPILASTNVEAIGVDLVSEPMTAAELAAVPGLKRKRLYAGVIDGRNVWKAAKGGKLDFLLEIKEQIPDLVVSTSCSLMHVPVDVLIEPDLPGDVADRLSFAKQKVAEVVALAKAITHGAPEHWYTRPATVHFKLKHDVRQRVANIRPDQRQRLPYDQRKPLQDKALGLPPVPTTTLGSFPQTGEVRQARYYYGQGRLTWEEYAQRLRDEIKRVIELQEDIGLDVLVHGEAERNDMVQYFAELMEGYVATHQGWVQVYGSRCVRPPIIYGDIKRKHPMTIEWTSYAQSLTDKPVKGILTGPVTMLARSFVRQDQPMYETAEQLALAVRDEIADLEKAGIKIIQVDEPSIRELLPLRERGRDGYLDWAVNAFRLAVGGAKPETQIHTHLGYSSIARVVEAFEAMDADVVSIVATRNIEWVFTQLAKGTALSHGVGPGVYESRSALIPEIDEIDERIQRATRAIDPERLWVNPDGGLKTRHYWQLEPSLRNMVAAARRERRRVESGDDD